MAHDVAKSTAARSACAWITDGMVLGLGTGSTARYVVERVAELVSGGLSLTGVATSSDTAEYASRLRVPLAQLDEVEAIDLCIDGADEVDPAGNLIKGGGGALTREKLVALAAREMIVVVDEGKLVDRLGLAFRLPVEILPFGVPHTMRRLAAHGEPELRRDAQGSVVTSDNGGNIVDLAIAGGIDAAAAATLDRELQAITGVVCSGIFAGLATRIIVGNDNRESRTLELA